MTHILLQLAYFFAIVFCAYTASWLLIRASRDQMVWALAACQLLSLCPLLSLCSIQCKYRLLGKNGDPSGPLHGICVQKRIPLVHPPQLADAPAKVEHPLRKGGLP